MKRAMILTSYLDGAKHLTPSVLDAASYDAVICADGGLRWAKRLDLTPTILIGDYDSMDRPTGENLIVLPQEKDMTDTEAALDLAIREGAKQIAIIGGLGGRFDHTMGNIGLLCKSAASGVQVSLEDGYNKVFLLTPGTYRLERGRFHYFSLIAYGGPVTGLTLEGAKYLLHNHTLTYDTSLGVSNEVASGYKQVTISFTDGLLLVIQTNDAD